jgi:DnaJ-class molecular chaperone
MIEFRSCAHDEKRLESLRGRELVSCSRCSGTGRKLSGFLCLRCNGKGRERK